MTIIFHPEVEDEFSEAIAYYEGCESGLGLDFFSEISTTLQSVETHPGLWPLVEENVHRCLVNRFPYGILYSIEPDSIYILAVMNLCRNPDYWKHRI